MQGLASAAIAAREARRPRGRNGHDANNLGDIEMGIQNNAATVGNPPVPRRPAIPRAGLAAISLDRPNPPPVGPTMANSQQPLPSQNNQISVDLLPATPSSVRSTSTNVIPSPARPTESNEVDEESCRSSYMTAQEEQEEHVDE